VRDPNCIERDRLERRPIQDLLGVRDWRVRRPNNKSVLAPGEDAGILLTGQDFEVPFNLSVDEDSRCPPALPFWTSGRFLVGARRNLLG